MTEVWALTASAGELKAAARDRLAHQMAEWLAAGNQGIALGTCHRVELYGLGVPPGLATPGVRHGAEAVSHLLRVAAGLESAIVGEDEVLHQVREALRSAQVDRRLDFRLQRLFETAIATGRRARSRRTESSGNLAQSAVAWLRTRSNVSNRMVIVAGAGRMGAALAHSLAAAGALVTIASRDEARAARLGRVYAGSGVSLPAGAELASKASAIAVALGGPWSELATAGGNALPPVVDISAPQAVPDVVRRQLNGTFLGIDDLYRRGDVLPGAYMRDAEAIVDRSAAEYLTWLARLR